MNDDFHGPALGLPYKAVPLTRFSYARTPT